MGKASSILDKLGFGPHDPRLILREFPKYGRILLIYDHVKFAETDEYLYHESLVHPAMATHGYPKDVLIIGGGDGLALREVLKWSSVENVDIVDSDDELISLGRGKLKDLNLNAFSDKRVNIFMDEEREFLQETDKRYDVIIIDAIDPEVDESVSRLFSKEFYLIARQKLKSDGVLVTRGSECESLTFARIYRTLASVFPIVKPYCVDIPSMGRVGFVIASNFHDPMSVTYVPPLQIKVYNLIFHMQLFDTYYNYHREANIITDSNPIKQDYFFSVKLHDDERIVKSARVRIIKKEIALGEGGEAEEIEKGYLAVTNKRYLLATVDGVYSFTEAKVYNYVRYLLIALIIEDIIATIVILMTEPFTLAIFLPLLIIVPTPYVLYERKKIRIKADTTFYKSNYKLLSEEGGRIETKELSTTILKDSESEEVLSLLMQNSLKHNRNKTNRLFWQIHYKASKAL